MFNIFKRRASDSSLVRSLDSVRFATNTYESGGEPRPGQLRIWFTPEGDGLGLYLFAVRPDIPSVRTLDELRAFYAAGLESSGGKIVEVSLVRLDGCLGVRVIFKTPQQPSGFTYVGSLTIPFQDFSFVIKIQCEECGSTGLREAVLLDQRLAAGEISSSNDVVQISDFNPDDESFDGQFPEHPASRVRKALSSVTQSLAVDDNLRNLPGFPLPVA